MASSFSEWLTVRGHTEATMEQTRRAQLFTFWQAEQAAPPPPTGLDAHGSEVKVGDVVTMTFRVSMTHAMPDASTVLNLDLLAADGTGSHYLSCRSSLVKRA